MADDDGERAGRDRCAWCGEPVEQPRTGRRRRYCRRTCRDYAYVSRRTERLIDEAVDQALGIAPRPELPALPRPDRRGADES